VWTWAGIGAHAVFEHVDSDGAAEHVLVGRYLLDAKVEGVEECGGGSPCWSRCLSLT
jgi:hypothetical protein